MTRNVKDNQFTANLLQNLQIRKLIWESRQQQWICYCVHPSFLSVFASFFIIFMTICGFHHDFRQMIPSTITKICQNVAQSALRRNQFWIVFKVICPLLLSNSCLSSNLFNDIYSWKLRHVPNFTLRMYSTSFRNSWRSQQTKCKFP